MNISTRKSFKGLAIFAAVFALGYALYLGVEIARYQTWKFRLERENPIGLTGDVLDRQPGYVYKPILVGVMKSAVARQKVGETVTFIGLDTPTPRVSYSDSGSDIPFQKVFESDDVVGIQLNTGHSLDSFVIDKETGIFSHAYTGKFMGVASGAGIGVCK